jgi:hypothetical protein
MMTELQGIMARTVPFEEWHGQRAWAEICPQCGDGQAAGTREMPRETWGTGFGPHETIRHIIGLLGSCDHVWHVLVGEDERRVLFYFVED